MTCFNFDLLGCVAESSGSKKKAATSAFVKLKQVKAAVSAGDIKYQIKLKA